ncbi:exported hypothetical protein [Arthrobacter sp. 9V]|uniref:SGNH/GDSL hydrolase family protein n=1 Tax=Arthrobacter sp. 9V TaxID=2653132 RepID=UPI0012F2441F|nr:SGNH/GDSL hydrolase family protein [Arthrobacter sp. 9V]VXC66304.1 exported hypothetical protein [Arthrobacter sp. 9V]
MVSSSRERKRGSAKAKIVLALFTLAIVGGGSLLAVKFADNEANLENNRSEAAAFTPAPIAAPADAIPPHLSGVSDALKNPNNHYVIGVLGDSTGNGPDEWVGKISQGLATEANRRVEFFNYNPQVSRYAEKRIYGPDTVPVEIYNVGIPGATAEAITTRFEGLFPKDPSLIIVSIGHNQLPANVSPDMERFTRAIEGKWPDAQVLLVGQNPATGVRYERQRMTVSTMMTWSRTWGYPSVSVFEAIYRTPDFESLYVDLLHVNDAGSAIWAGVVQRYLLDNA